MARPICLRLLLQVALAAASRVFWTAGNSMPMRIPMMAMTTSSSISVNADRRYEAGAMALLLDEMRTGGRSGRCGDVLRSAITVSSVGVWGGWGGGDLSGRSLATAGDGRLVEGSWIW